MVECVHLQQGSGLREADTNTCFTPFFNKKKDNLCLHMPVRSLSRTQPLENQSITGYPHAFSWVSMTVHQYSSKILLCGERHYMQVVFGLQKQCNLRMTWQGLALWPLQPKFPELTINLATALTAQNVKSSRGNFQAYQKSLSVAIILKEEQTCCSFLDNWREFKRVRTWFL